MTTWEIICAYAERTKCWFGMHAWKFNGGNVMCRRCGRLRYPR